MIVAVVLLTAVAATAGYLWGHGTNTADWHDLQQERHALNQWANNLTARETAGWDRESRQALKWTAEELHARVIQSTPTDQIDEDAE